MSAPVLSHPDYDRRLWNHTRSADPARHGPAGARGLREEFLPYRRWGISPRPENFLPGAQGSRPVLNRVNRVDLQWSFSQGAFDGEGRRPTGGKESAHSGCAFGLKDFGAVPAESLPMFLTCRAVMMIRPVLSLHSSKERQCGVEVTGKWRINYLSAVDILETK